VGRDFFWGSARFDGTEFKVYNSTDGLSSTVITGLVLDSRNRLSFVIQRSEQNGRRSVYGTSVGESWLTVS